jgi:hypothetical protein
MNPQSNYDYPDLRERVAILENNHNGLKETVSELKGSVKELTQVASGLKESMDKGRGILYTIGGISGGVGAAVSAFVSNILHK